MPIYAVEIITVAVVEAASMGDARQVANGHLRDAARDGPTDFLVLQEITNLQDLPDEWDGECLPYGGDGEKRLKELLPPNPMVSRPGTGSA